MQPLASDTPAHVEAEIMAVLCGMSPAQKAGMLAQVSAASDQLAMLGIRTQHAITPAMWGHYLALRRLLPERRPAATQLLTALPALTFPVNPVAIAVWLGALLDRLALDYFIGGSFASSIIGEYRTIRDLDVVVQLADQMWEALAGALRPAFTFIEEELASASARADALNEGGAWVALYDRATGFQVDLLLAREGPFVQAQLQRRTRTDLGEGMVWLPSAEDAILSGLHWYSRSPSDTQWRDIQAMLRVQAPTLDIEYLRAWASVLSIVTLAEQALAGARSLTQRR